MKFSFIGINPMCKILIDGACSILLDNLEIVGGFTLYELKVRQFSPEFFIIFGV
jgi:hypothetical protein